MQCQLFYDTYTVKWYFLQITGYLQTFMTKNGEMKIIVFLYAYLEFYDCDCIP